MFINRHTNHRVPPTTAPHPNPHGRDFRLVCANGLVFPDSRGRLSLPGMCDNRGHSFWGSFDQNRHTSHGIASIPRRGGVPPPAHDKSIPIAPRRRNHGNVCTNGIILSGGASPSPTRVLGMLRRKSMQSRWDAAIPRRASEFASNLACSCRLRPPRTYIPRLHRPRGCTNTVGTGVLDCPFTARPPRTRYPVSH